MSEAPKLNSQENGPSTQELLAVLPAGTVPARLNEVTSTERELILKQWKTFLRIASLPVPENQLLKRRERGEPELVEGTLIHGIRTWSRDIIESVARVGIVSGEMVGVHEDNETHFCADFFRIPSATSIAQYVNWYETTSVKTPGGLTMKVPEANFLPRSLGRTTKRLAFIVDTPPPELQPLLAYDAYQNADIQKITRNLVEENSETRSRVSAIVCGIPSNFLSGILITSALENDKEDLAYIRALFGERMPIFNIKGELVPV